MRMTLAGFAAVAILGVAGSQTAAAMPIAKVTDQAQAAPSNVITVQYRRRHYRGRVVRHYRRYGPRYGGYVGPGPYYAWGYPYRHYPYPYRYYGPGVGVRIGPFGFGLW